jgi:hypothetical protein
MWHLVIPIPNWTGFILGFITAFIVFFAWGTWLRCREQKRLEKAQKEAFAKLKSLN